MTTYNTGNPIGSTAVQDLYDNAENLDVLVNDRTQREHEDRLGVPRKTWRGMEQDFQDFLISSGYQNIGDYGAGLEITARNQIFWRDGELYRAGASLELPYTTTGSWASEEALFVVVGDQALRQDLADGSSTGRGVAMIGFAGGTLADQLADEGVPPEILVPSFPRIIKYNSGPVSTRALGITAGSTSIGAATARLKSALGDGLDVYIEPSENVLQVNDVLVSARQGQVVCGAGYFSRLQQMEDAATLLSILNDDVIVRDLHLFPTAVKTSTFTGFGAYASGCDRPIFENIYVSGGRSGGLGFENVNGGVIRDTRHFLSAVNPATDDHTQSGCDIALYKSCNDCLVDNVASDSGIGMTVNIQTAVLGPIASARNIVSNINVKNQTAYGIQLYVSDKSTQSIENTTIINPMIDGVSGAIVNGSTSTKTYGAGIYIQGAEHSTIIGGHIRRTNLETDSETLAPGGIGVTNALSFLAQGTRIQDCEWYGVFVSDPATQGVAGGYGMLRDISISGSGRSGVRQVTFRRLKISGGSSNGNAIHGLEALKTTSTGVDTEIEEWMANNNTQCGITTSDTSRITLKGCFVAGNGDIGVNIGADVCEVDDIIIQDSVSVGLRILASNSSGYIRNTVSRGNLIGIQVVSGSDISVMSETNTVSGNGTNFGGVLHPVSGWRTLANVATPTLSGKTDWYITGGTTAITGFYGGYPGQRITIFSGHTVTILGLACVHGDVIEAVNSGGSGWRLVKG